MPSDPTPSETSPPRPSKVARYTALLILATTATYTLCLLVPDLMLLAGVSHHGVWFMDTYAILAALDAQRLGLDPYAYNPLNHFGGPHVYSHWWLWLDGTGLTRTDALWLGATVCGVALATAWWILRPRNRWELGYGLAVLCSAPLILGLNRANADLLLFALLSLCVPCILSRSRFWRIAGAPVLIALGMGLKFYPVLAGLIVLAVQPRRDRLLALALLIVLIIPVGLNIVPDLASYQADNLPAGLYTFGATIALSQAGLSPTGAGLVALLFLGFTGSWFLRRTRLGTWTVPAGLKVDYLLFILGAAVLTGSFLLTVNYAYRWFYALWLLPFLCRAEIPATSRLVRQWLVATRALLLIVLWSEMVATVALNGLLSGSPQPIMDGWGDLINALLQPATWLLFACLSGWLAHFITTQLRESLAPAALPEA